jgi:hypothetical protein
MTTPEHTPAYPRIDAALSRHIARVAAASTYRLDPERIASLTDTGVYVIEEPVRLHYDDAKLGFELPPAPFVWLSTLAGRIWEIKASPSLDVEPLADAYRDAKQLSQTLDDTPWKAVSGLLPSRADVAEEFAASPRDQYAFRVRAWEVDKSRLALSIKRMRRGGSGVDGDRFILDVRIASMELYDRYTSMVRQKRLLRGDPQTPLPLSAWPDEG